MQLHQLIDNSYHTFLHHLDTARIILLHPQSRYRSMLIARLISTPELNVYYYAMGPDDINLQSFISSIGHTLANQHPTFGRHINILPQNVYENPEDHFELVLQTFIKDLAEIMPEARGQIEAAFSGLVALGDEPTLPLIVNRGTVRMGFLTLGQIPPLD